jgi:peptidoglycan/LPS O-acetylase OafA/YrhL
MPTAPLGYSVPFSQRIRQQHLPALDGLRALAVAGVILFHFGFLSFSFGILGVSLFFVISGFLITHLLLREHETGGGISFSRFYARRALRIFPAYYVFLAVSFVYMAVHAIPLPPRLVASSILYYNDYVQAFGQDRANLISHSWSLAIEEQFYLLWPFGLTLLLRRRSGGVGILGVAVVCIAAWRTMLFALGHGSYTYYAFDTRVDQLLIGCGLAIVARQPEFDRIAGVASRSAVFPLLTATAAVLLFQIRMAGLMASVGYSIIGMLFGLFLVQTIMLSGHPAWRWLDSPPVRFIGRISYPLYLYHKLAAALVDAYAPGLRWSVQIVPAFAVTLGLAMASYYLVERPFLSLKSRVSPPVVP